MVKSFLFLSTCKDTIQITFECEDTFFKQITLPCLKSLFLQQTIKDVKNFSD
jgi:hypothetical protein